MDVTPDLPQEAPKKSRINLVTTSVVMLTVGLNIFAAWIMDEAANMGATISLISLAVIGIVILLNVGRFVMWGWIHHRINLAKSYPLTAVFFPLIGLLSYYRGEPINAVQWVGIGLITLGVVWFTVFVPDN